MNFENEVLCVGGREVGGVGRESRERESVFCYFL